MDILQKLGSAVTGHTHVAGLPTHDDILLEAALEIERLREENERYFAAVMTALWWFETQAKVISKGSGSSWDLMQVREQRDALEAVLTPNVEFSGERSESAATQG